jgi:hypothetical protein
MALCQEGRKISINISIIVSAAPHLTLWEEVVKEGKSWRQLEPYGIARDGKVDINRN